MKPIHLWGLLASLAFLLNIPTHVFGSENVTPADSAQAPISLAGQWRFELDPRKEGVTAGWFNTSLPEQIKLPGSCEERGFGTKPAAPYVGKLTPQFVYNGPAWYQRDITVPREWQGKRVELYLERCLWESSVWLDGNPSGAIQDSLSAPHVHDLGIVPVGPHVLTICIDNTYKLKIGTWISAITDDTQGRWNGIIGRIELLPTDPVWIADIQAYPNYHQQTVDIKGRLGNSTGKSGNGSLQVNLIAPGGTQAVAAPKVPVNWTGDGGTFETTVPLSLAGTPQSWDEFNPRLYKIQAGLDGSSSQVTATFGLRILAAHDEQIFVNDRPTLLRGPVDECVYPLTGHPPMDKTAWTRVLKISQSYGFNYMRFHSWCPPEAAFEAADDLGFLIQVELPLWTIDAPPFGQDPARDQFERDELNRILDAYGNHPSFGIMGMGNESQGPLDQLTAQGHARDDRHLFRAEGDHDPAGGYREGGVRGIYGPRTDWDRNSQSSGWIANSTEPPHAGLLPFISHEVGQWCMYPDFDQIKKYTGIMQPDNFTSYRNSLEAHGMLDQDKAFADASGKFSVLLYKDEIEGCFRTWPLGGFQMLEARDYPGQGTAVVGWLDSFWDSKGLITPAEFDHFCGPVVCLLRMSKRIWTTAETFEAQVQVSNYSQGAVNDTAVCTITDEHGKEIANGTLPAQSLQGRVTTLGPVHVPLSTVSAAERLVVKVALGNTGIENSWNIWVYPAQLPPEPPPRHSVYIVHDFDEATQEALRNGKRVLLFPPVTALSHSVPGSFMPVFWCVRLFSQTGTMGLLCDPSHPALAEFPTESHSDWEWADILGNFSAAASFKVAGAPPEVYEQLSKAANDVSNRSKAIILDDSPPEYRPIVQVVDNYDRNHKLGAIFEANVDAGSLLVCAMDLETDKENRPAARQLYRSLMDYVTSDKFQPKQELSMDYLQKILALSPTEKLGVH
jgi:hypothetical protein